jgi:hypothetical protein
MGPGPAQINQSPLLGLELSPQLGQDTLATSARVLTAETVALPTSSILPGRESSPPTHALWSGAEESLLTLPSLR